MSFDVLSLRPAEECINGIKNIINMREVNIRAVDLNLLVILEQLLIQPTVSAAAEELEMSQPAASRALARLRRLFQDPLLVPCGRTLMPTPRAEELLGPLQRVLQETRRLINPASFVPEEADFAFRLYTLDFESLVFLPAFLNELKSRAPMIQVDIPPRVQDPIEELRQGRVDLVTGAPGSLAGDFHRRTLFEERFVAVTCGNHPRLRDGLTLEKYVELEHVMITTSGAPGGPVDDLLAERGLTRRVGLRLPHFLAAPLAVAETDMILTLPERLATRAAQWADLKIWELPLALEGFSIDLIWHERLHSEPAHRWIRDLALQCGGLL